MSFSIEKLITVELYCYKCEEKLVRSTKDMIIGACMIFDCPKCGYTVLIQEGGKKS